MSRLRWAGILAASLFFLFFWLLSFRPEWVEAGYSNGAYPLLFRLLASVTGRIPFSTAAVVLCLLPPLLLAYAVWRFRQLRNRQKTLRPWLGKVLLDLLFTGLTVGAAGYALWGLNYARHPLPLRLNWDPAPFQRDRLEEILPPLVADTIALTNAAFETCCGSDGRLPTVSETSLDQLNQRLNQGLEEAVAQLKLPTPRLGSIQAKPFPLSPLMSYLGLAGFHFPWTAEANFNRDMLPLEAVHSIAHEKAHQMGFAREDEANFVGFLGCVYSEDPYAHYSGYYFATRQLLSLLRRVDRASWQEIGGQLNRRVAEDAQLARNFWRAYEGPGREVARVVNDAHLRLNRVPGGVLSYGRSVQLLLQFARHNGGRLRVKKVGGNPAQ